LYEKYSEDVEFLTIYIREAHPKDGWWLGGGIAGMVMKFYAAKAATDVYDPRSIQERRGVAERCETALQYGIPTLVDDMDDSVNRTYAAMPTRLYLIGMDGRVVYAGGLGPWGFRPEELKDAIQRLPESRVVA
jgi:hypothetical protein